jgi:UDP-N-acetylmuramate dehydrogenase
VIDRAARAALEACLAERIEFDVPLARHTSLRIGGPADAIATPRDREELARVLSICDAHELPTIVLGAGFNVLVREGGIRGVVLRLKKLRAIERVAGDAISVEAGASHATITRYCVEHGLAGLEFGAGIPGTLGGWLAMNAGIGVREMKDVVREIEVIDRRGKAFSRLPRTDLDFRYRALEGLAPGTLITSAVLAVEATERTRVQHEIDRLLAHRQATQPIDIPSCGSVFRNPPGDFAGRLIEAAGLKGERVGAAEISTVHANFIVNHGGATARDVLALIERARATVESATGVALEPEVRVLGEAQHAERRPPAEAQAPGLQEDRP